MDGLIGFLLYEKYSLLMGLNDFVYIKNRIEKGEKGWNLVMGSYIYIYIYWLLKG